VNPDAEAIIQFWLGPADDNSEAAVLDAKHRNRLWYRNNPETDSSIRSRFGDLHQRAGNGDLSSWVIEPRSGVALVILLDQFSRNLHRRSPEAFANDELALKVASTLLEEEGHLSLSIMARVFLYHPFHHAENLSDQCLAVSLFSELETTAPAHWQTVLQSYRQSAQGHCDIVTEFGRFPHRNETLGRRSTPAEVNYLKSGRRFGQ